MDVTLRQLRAFVAVAQTGGFTRAAESLHITQSALSGLIKELESQLGLRLIDRSTRRVYLSELGTEFHAVAVRILRDLDIALENLDNIKRLRRGLVRIAAPQLMASTVLPSALAEFRRIHPDVEIHLQDCAVENVISDVLSGEVDIGIGPQRDPVAGLAVDPLFELPFMVVFPAGHALEACANIGWQDLAAYPLITLEGQFTDQLSREVLASHSAMAIQPAHQVAFMSTALSMVHSGLGITVCMPYARSLVDLYGLRLRPLSSPQILRRFFVYSRQHVSLPPAAQAFVQYLHSYVEQREWD